MSWGVRKFSDGRQWYRTDRWQRLRVQVLREDPLCVMCSKREGCAGIATEVDHIKPHRGDRALFYARQNLQSMCRSCHSQKTAREVLGKGPGADEHGLPLDSRHHWNQEN
jgi:5-methylcytosine-specific restriction protein A